MTTKILHLLTKPWILWTNILKSDMSKSVKDDEFRISLSMEDIDKIDEEIKNIESSFKKTTYVSDPTKIKNTKLTEDKQNYNVINGVILHNRCVTCHNKFKPTNSMIDETSCNVCSERK